jgi:hypothetical protein
MMYVCVQIKEKSDRIDSILSKMCVLNEELFQFEKFRRQCHGLFSQRRDTTSDLVARNKVYMNDMLMDKYISK